MTPLVTASPVIVALDTDDIERLRVLAEAVAPSAGLVKVGLEAYVSLGAGAVEVAAKAAPVFLDLKLHDIPNTVAGAAGAAARLGVSLLTVHASGGAAMIAAAVAAAPDVGILAVTVLTSLNGDALTAVGQPPAGEQVPRLAKLAIEAGAAGVVCSPHEIAAVRQVIGPQPLVVVPGVRPAGAARDDQARVATPRDAMSAGASHIVVGRPVTNAADPGAAAAAILAELQDANP